MSSTDHRPGRVLDLTAFRAQLARARVDQFEMESLPAAGELLTAAEIEGTVIANIDQIRSRMMTMFSEIAPRLVRIETAAEAHRIVATAVYQVLEKSAADARAAASDDLGGNPADGPETA